MLAVTPVASAPAFAALMASRRSSRLSELSTAMVRPLITKVPLCPSAVSSAPMMPSLAILCAAAICWTSMVWLAAWLRLVDRDADDLRRLGWRAGVGAAGRRKGPLGFEHVARAVEARHAAQLVERALQVQGKRPHVLERGDLHLVVRDALLDAVDRNAPRRDQPVDRLLQIDPAGQAGERGPAAAVDHQVVEVEIGRHDAAPIRRTGRPARPATGAAPHRSAGAGRADTAR